MTEQRRYYHQRTGAHAPPKLDLDQARSLIAATYSQVQARGFFQEALGYYCVDARNVPGSCGEDIAGWIKVEAWLEDVYPFQEKIPQLDEAIVFAVVELLWDLVSEPIETPGAFHSFSGCGWHYRKFNKAKGQLEWREKINRVLEFYADGFQLSDTGEVQRVADPELVSLMATPIAPVAGDANRALMLNAIGRFRSGKSSIKDRKDAVEDLIKVLEFYRPQVKQYMFRKDEDELFVIANKFALRHHNELQKSDYGDDWVDWAFYMYLASIHLVLNLVARGRE